MSLVPEQFVREEEDPSPWFQPLHRPDFDESAYEADLRAFQWTDEAAARLRRSADPPPRPPGIPPQATERRAWLTHVREFPPDPDGVVYVAKGPLVRLAERARARRVELGLTRGELAQRAGVPHATLKHFERTGAVSIAALYLLAIELGRAADLDAVFVRRRPDTPAVLARRSTLRRRGRAGTAAERLR